MTMIPTMIMQYEDSEINPRMTVINSLSQVRKFKKLEL